MEAYDDALAPTEQALVERRSRGLSATRNRYAAEVAGRKLDFAALARSVTKSLFYASSSHTSRRPYVTALQPCQSAFQHIGKTGSFWRLDASHQSLKFFPYEHLRASFGRAKAHGK